MEPTGALGLQVVEDDPSIRELLHSIFLGTAGITVIGTYDSAEAILSTASAAQAPDVVIMDINLPGLSGIDCLRQLAPMWPGTQFLMYTVNDTDDKVFEALKAGANGYLLKNASPERIIEAVFDIKRGGAPMSMPVARRVIRHFRPTRREDFARETELSEREASILEHLAEGLLYKEIAARLGITEGAVKQHIHRIYGKLHVANRTEAVNRYFGR